MSAALESAAASLRSARGTFGEVHNRLCEATSDVPRLCALRASRKAAHLYPAAELAAVVEAQRSACRAELRTKGAHVTSLLTQMEAERARLEKERRRLSGGLKEEAGERAAALKEQLEEEIAALQREERAADTALKRGGTTQQKAMAAIDALKQQLCSRRDEAEAVAAAEAAAAAAAAGAGDGGGDGGGGGGGGGGVASAAELEAELHALRRSVEAASDELEQLDADDEAADAAAAAAAAAGTPAKKRRRLSAGDGLTARANASMTGAQVELLRAAVAEAQEGGDEGALASVRVEAAREREAAAARLAAATAAAAEGEANRREAWKGLSALLRTLGADAATGKAAVALLEAMRGGASAAAAKGAIADGAVAEAALDMLATCGVLAGSGDGAQLA